MPLEFEWDIMKKATNKRRNADILDEYDFSNGVRGKYAKRYTKGTNLVLLTQT